MAKKIEAKKAEDTVKIMHHRSGDFSSHHVTGTLISGPTPDSFYHFIFYADAIAINHETGVKIEGTDDEYKPTIRDGDIEKFREDKVRISMSPEGMRRLKKLLDENFTEVGDEEGR